MMRYQVEVLRNGGLAARWGKLPNGQPAIFVCWPQSLLEHQRNRWWLVTASMWTRMQNVGVLEGFKNDTLLGDVFSI